jgi:poly(A) polymerase
MTEKTPQLMSEEVAPRILARPDHTVSRGGLSQQAIKVLYRLYRSGYTAYLVGGSVRDLLLGRTPKDFDIATNARPQEIRRLFRNSRIIGRRFRLVHVIFREEIVEVATFRASPEPPEGPDDWEEAVAEAAETDAEIDRLPAPPREDRAVYGTPAEDAQRRDFTVNGLFYDISDFSVIDYVGGLDDLEAGLIRTIGPPERRFREDPVRMLRALEYAARLGFELESSTREAVVECRDEISEASAARLSYELLETLRSGNSAAIYSAWRAAGLFDRAFPDVGGSTDDVVRSLEAVDTAVGAGAQLTDSTLVGSMYLHRFYREFGELTRDNGKLDNVAMLRRLGDMLEPAATNLRLPNHVLHLMSQGLFTLSKMHRPPERGRQVLKLSRNEYFGVAWSLFRLAEMVGLVPAEAFKGWSNAVARLQSGGEKSQRDPRSTRSRRRRRPRRRRRQR